MPGYAFRHALRYRAETLHACRDGPTRFVGILSKQSHLGPKVIQGSIWLRNALWLPNLVRRALIRNSALLGSEDMQGSSRVNQGSNCLEMPYGHQIWWEESLTKAQCIAGVKGHIRVSWGQVGVNVLSDALWPPNLVGRTPDQSVMHCWVESHAGVIWGQPRVKLLRNALWSPNLVGRITDQSVMHCWGQRSCRGQLGSSRGQFT